MKLSERVKTAIFAVGLALAGIGVAMAPRAVYAVDKDKDVEGEGGSSAASYIREGVDKTGLQGGTEGSLEDRIQGIIKVILWAVGILSVIVIIYGGIQYTLSTGDQSKVTAAKNTIIYGIVGLAISILAYAIVSFVVDKISGTSGTETDNDSAMVIEDVEIAEPIRLGERVELEF